MIYRTSSLMVINRVTDSSGQLEVTEITQRPLVKELLDTMDAFILDCGMFKYLSI